MLMIKLANVHPSFEGCVKCNYFGKKKKLIFTVVIHIYSVLKILNQVK
jgi:hypothetical protein